MSRETSNLGLILYDPSEDKDVKVRDLINKVLGFTDSNTIKIDAKTKDIDTNIKTLHDSIIGTDGNVVFYNKQEVFLAVHPVGSIFLSTDGTEPAELYGGTWERIEDCTIWGASDTHPAGTKLEAGLPNITGYAYTRGADTTASIKQSVIFDDGAGGAFSVLNDVSEYTSFYDILTKGGKNNSAKLSFNASTSNPIYGASDTVQPPAYCMYIWRRVA